MFFDEIVHLSDQVVHQHHQVLILILQFTSGVFHLALQPVVVCLVDKVGILLLSLSHYLLANLCLLLNQVFLPLIVHVLFLELDDPAQSPVLLVLFRLYLFDQLEIRCRQRLVLILDQLRLTDHLVLGVDELGDVVGRVVVGVVLGLQLLQLAHQLHQFLVHHIRVLVLGLRFFPAPVRRQSSPSLLLLVEYSGVGLLVELVLPPASHPHSQPALLRDEIIPLLLGVAVLVGGSPLLESLHKVGVQVLGHLLVPRVLNFVIDFSLQLVKLGLLVFLGPTDLGARSLAASVALLVFFFLKNYR